MFACGGGGDDARRGIGVPPAAGIVVEFYFGKERSEVGERISGWALKLRLEEFQIDRAGDDVVATDEVRGDLDEGKGELGFEIKLVAHDHFAVCAILACFALYYRAPSFDVDQERELARIARLLAGRAAAQAEGEDTVKWTPGGRVCTESKFNE